jgi:hypothetical protein
MNRDQQRLADYLVHIAVIGAAGRRCAAQWVIAQGSTKRGDGDE